MNEVERKLDLLIRHVETIEKRLFDGYSPLVKIESQLKELNDNVKELQPSKFKGMVEIGVVATILSKLDDINNSIKNIRE